MKIEMSEFLKGRADLVNYRILNNLEQRTVIKRRAKEMVLAVGDVDMVIFLDRTARPLSTLLLHLWPFFFTNKEEPEIRFINIGTEKQDPLHDYIWEHVKRSTGRFPSGICTEELIYRLPFVNDEDIKQAYGESNLDYLRQLLRSPYREKRLVVDDKSCWGTTVALTERILRTVDSQNDYIFFIFLESERDSKPFWEPSGRAVFMPWQSTESPHKGFIRTSKSLTAQSADWRSFVCGSETDEDLRAEGLQLRRELIGLAEEIGIERNNSLFGRFGKFLRWR